MSQPMHILAAQDPIVTLIVMLFFGVVWVLSQVMAAMAEKRKKQKGPPVPRPPRGVPPDRPEPVRESRPPRPPRGERPPVRQPSTPKTTSRRRPPPLQSSVGPVTAMEPPAYEHELYTAQAYHTKLEKRETAKAESPDSLARVRTLLRPRNLRKEYILTEILQPPVALRPASEQLER